MDILLTTWDNLIKILKNNNNKQLHGDGIRIKLKNKIKTLTHS